MLIERHVVRVTVGHPENNCDVFFLVARRLRMATRPGHFQKRVYRETNACTRYASPMADSTLFPDTPT